MLLRLARRNPLAVAEAHSAAPDVVVSAVDFLNLQLGGNRPSLSWSSFYPDAQRFAELFHGQWLPAGVEDGCRYRARSAAWQVGGLRSRGHDAAHFGRVNASVVHSKQAARSAGSNPAEGTLSTSGNRPNPEPIPSG